MRQFLRRALKASPNSFRERLLRQSVAAADDDAKFRVGQPTMWGSLQNLARIGFRPGGIIDVGANVGAWSSRMAKIFPDSPIHMIEAQPSLESVLAASRIPYTMALLGPEERSPVPFYLSGTGSSVMEEVTSFDRDVIELPVKRLDDIEPVAALRTPLLLKMDVQGYELEVLAGASETLKRTEVILSEVSLLEYNKGAPLMHEVIDYLASREFLPYDICGGLRRSSDSALFQTDMIFVRRDSQLRSKRKFWGNEPD
jgi:FkbM family methyltransferase